MSMTLCNDEFEQLKEDIADNSFRGVKYLDTWDYEDDWSHNDIENARDKFIEMANEYFEEQNLPYIMKEICENAMVCDKESGEIIYQPR